MSVLDASELNASPLPDLHAIARELGIDGYRRLRKADLIDAILVHQGGEPAVREVAPVEAEDAPARDEDDAPARPRRARGGRGRGRARDADTGDDDKRDADKADDADERPARTRGGRGRGPKPANGEGGGRDGGGREGGGRGRGPKADNDEPTGEERIAEGIVEVLGNGSGFLRVNGPDASDEDIYISAAQVRRCELVSGDTVAGPVRPPRRSERYPSLVRVDTINGEPADSVSEGTRWDDLPAAFPTERLTLGGEDPTVKAIEWLTPIGKGSRVVFTGPARSGKSEGLRRLAAALAGTSGIELTVVLSGTRPEEVTEWQHGPVPPATVAPLGTSPDSQSQAVERAIDAARRSASRGGDAVVMIDSLDLLPVPVARKALAAARNIADGGSLTVIAVATTPLGGETTVVAFNDRAASIGRFPSIDMIASGVLRPELLVGEAGAKAIAKARTDALGA